MDDLDHSMHIAEHDWWSFYDETEECWLLQPLLACPDNWSLSDSEDSGNSSVVLSSGRAELRQSPASTSDDGESNTAGCCAEDVQISQSCSGGEQDHLITKAEEDSGRRAKSDIRFNFTAICTEGACMGAAEHILDVTNIAAAVQSEQQNAESPDGEATELKKGDGDMQKDSDTLSLEEPDPLSGNQRELNVNEPHTAERDVSSVPRRTEKERWFITVSDRPAPRWVRSKCKKKTRQKKTCKNNRMPRSLLEKKAHGNGRELEIHCESEAGRETDGVTQSNDISGGCPNSEENPESVLMGITSEMPPTSDEMLTAEVDNQDPSSTASMTVPTGLDSAESDETGDGLEFLSSHSWDSDSYLSATETAEEPWEALITTRHVLSSSPLTKNTNLLSLSENTGNHTQDRIMYSCRDTAPHSVTTANGGSADVTPNFPSVAKFVNKTLDEGSQCDADTHCAQLCLLTETPGLQTHESINPAASVGSLGDPLSPPPLPDVTQTPCSTADSPETYAAAAGRTRSVYAISTFWDEMEKLTINDILQLRVGRSTPPRDTHKTATAHADDSAENPSSVVDPVEYSLPDAGLTDTSDTADSDYFTQPDDSKPDRSSCEFSASDFEEEYWQFLGTRRNPSPDPQAKNQPRTRDSPGPAHEEEESTASEGRDTPVPPDDFADKCFQEQEPFISNRLILKSKSVRNIHALNTEDLSVDSRDESGLFLHSCLSSDGEKLLDIGDSLETQIPAPFLPNTVALGDYAQISFPEVFECDYTQENAETNSRPVIVFSPDGLSLAPVLDHPLPYAFRDETSLSFLCYSHYNKEKPIPIFSYSHPTIRELTFPNYVFLGADSKEDNKIFPFRVVSHLYMRGTDCGQPRDAFHTWKSFLPMRKISFSDKGSIWCKGSGAWVFPFDDDKFCTEKADPPDLRGISSALHICRDPAGPQRILDPIEISKF